ncbi:LysR family transcriptional regulator [Silicimonas sp. MF1-12-2]|jgi:DNA-binding transcriptional LysR family regulator|uniref:LysR family transcriptional regulator n=1 Tax=Silicimonas sp. MF1-12-2 TaxID=3384793 RepID=UPI0039B5C8E7
MRNNWHSIREYEALRAVISSGTTNGAARLLGVSQPAVSRAIAQLEARLNLVLFERRGGRLRPTAEGMRLNGNLDRLFDAIAILNGADPEEPGSGTLRLAAPPSLSQMVASQMASFIALHPGQRLSLETCTSTGLVSRINEDAVDLGFTHADLTHSSMELIPFHESVAVCILPPNHPLSRHAVITPELLHGQDFISILRRHIVRSRLDRLFAEAGAVPNRVAEVATGLSAVTLVRAGTGVSVICPFPVVREDDPALVVRPFLPRFVYRTSFAVSTARPLTRIARAFMRHVKLSLA